MKVKNTSAVYRAWLNGERAHSGNVSTDGVGLWSYSLQIGTRAAAGPAVAAYVSAGEFASVTTSKHARAAARAAGVDLMAVEAFRVLIGG